MPKKDTFTKLLDDVMADKRLTHWEATVLCFIKRICSMKRNKGVCRRKMGTIAGALKMSLRTTERAVSKLEEKGVISIERRASRANKYRLVEPEKQEAAKDNSRGKCPPQRRATPPPWREVPATEAVNTETTFGRKETGEPSHLSETAPEAREVNRLSPQSGETQLHLASENRVHEKGDAAPTAQDRVVFITEHWAELKVWGKGNGLDRLGGDKPHPGFFKPSYQLDRALVFMAQYEDQRAIELHDVWIQNNPTNLGDAPPEIEEPYQRAINRRRETAA